VIGVVGTTVVLSIVAVGRGCVPAAASVMSGRGVAADGRRSDSPSIREILWGA
jgi:hypothetical protein